MKLIFCFLVMLSSCLAFAQSNTEWIQFKKDNNLPSNLAYNDYAQNPGKYLKSGTSTAQGNTPMQQMILNLSQTLIQQGLNNLLNGSPADNARKQAEQQTQQELQNEANQLNNSGIYLLRQKSYAGAVNEFQLALAKTPNDQNIIYNLGFAKQQLKNSGLAAQNSRALGQLLGSAPADESSVNFDRLTHSSIQSPNSSALNLVNLDTDPNVVDLRGTTKTYVDPALVKGNQLTSSSTQLTDKQQTMQELDNLFDKVANDDQAINAKKYAAQQQTLQELDNVLDKTSNDDLATNLKKYADQQQTQQALDNVLDKTSNDGLTTNLKKYPTQQQTLQALDNVLDNKADQDLKRQLDDFNKNSLSQSSDLNGAKSIPDLKNPVQSQNTDVQSVKATDRVLGQPATVAPGENLKDAPANKQTTQADQNVQLSGQQSVAFSNSNVVGTDNKADHQLVSATAIAAAKGDPGAVYDGGARPAGFLAFPINKAIDPSTFSAKVKNDPRMIAAMKQLNILQANRSQLGMENNRLTASRNAEINDPAKFAELNTKLDQNNRNYQNTLKALSDINQTIEQLSREIDAVPQNPPKN